MSPADVDGGTIEKSASVQDMEPLARANVTRSHTFTEGSNGVVEETPPAVPPRPIPPPPKQLIVREQAKRMSSNMGLADLIKNHHKSFPLRILITNGYLGETARSTISTGDRYNIHFLKHTRVMLFRDSYDTPYSIPINSAIEFSPLYEPKEGRKPEDVDVGVVFTSVADIMAQADTPKMVAVLGSWQSHDHKVSLLTNETLIIKSTQRSMFSKKGLKVYSLTTKSNKFIPEDCPMSFSTQPTLCRLHITDIMEHLKNPKGLHFVLFLNSQVLENRELSSTLQEIPQELFQKVLTLVDQVTETSLIASSVLAKRKVNNVCVQRNVLLF